MTEGLSVDDLAMQEMRHSADVLAAGLLEMADPELSARYFRQKQQVTSPFNIQKSESHHRSHPAEEEVYIVYVHSVHESEDWNLSMC